MKLLILFISILSGCTYTYQGPAGDMDSFNAAVGNNVKIISKKQISYEIIEIKYKKRR